MSVDIEYFTPWSELEGKEIKKEIEKAKNTGDTKKANVLEAIDAKACITEMINQSK